VLITVSYRPKLSHFWAYADSLANLLATDGWKWLGHHRRVFPKVAKCSTDARVLGRASL
jgi:hypothetical protein